MATPCFAITGGCGYIGLRLARYLLEINHLNTVVLLDIHSPSIDKEDLNRLTYRYCDIRSYKSVYEALSNITCVFHLASYGMSGREMLNRSMIYDVNVNGTNNIINACIEHKITKLIYCSTYNAVYTGNKELINVTENKCLYPAEDKYYDNYSRTKSLAEQSVLKACSSTFHTIAIRPAAIYGDGELRHLPRILNLVRQGLVFFAIGDENVLCDWVYADNLVYALVLAEKALPKYSGEAYFISDDKPVNNFQFLSQLTKGLGYNYCFAFYIPTFIMFYLSYIIEIIHYLFAKYIYNFSPFLTRAEVLKVGVTHYANITKAKNDLSYQVKISPDEAMQRYKMSTNIVDEPLLTSYEFCDANKAIIVTLYANGAFEVKDVEIFIETDSLDVRTPANERWIFQLWEHIYSDQVEITTTVNSALTQTSIEIRLIKQQPRKIWPQLYSLGSVPITPQRDGQINEYEDINMINQQQYDLSIKKLKTDFYETNEKFTSIIYIKQIRNCHVYFTETNFTAIFNTDDEQILNSHLTSSERLIKLFVRVKERIIPNKCSYKITPTFIEIILVKDNPNNIKWGRLEPSEYSESRPTIQQTTPSTPPSSPTNIINSNKAIPLPPPPPPPPPSTSTTNRQSDKYPSASAFASSIHQKENTYTPTVSPSSSSLGFTGIHNPANSCFMNAAIQCLANTRELRDYFLESAYLSEINRTNPLGMKGAMAEEFGNAFAAQRHSEFVGNGQHDAQELLTILLDAIHEDLNRVINKPQVPPVEAESRPDNVVADEYWRGYLSRNDSIIVQLFTGQFKSKTKCPQCHKESVTFDPFTSLSVPLPKRTAVDTIVTYRNDEKPSTKYRIIMSADGLIHEFKRLLSVKCGLPANKMIAYKIRGNRTVEHLKNDDRAASTSYTWNNSDIIYITETLTSSECNNESIIHLTFIQRVFKLSDYVTPCGYCQAPPNPHTSSKFCPNCYQVFYCDELCQKLHLTEHKNYCGFRLTDNYEVIGIPFIISLPESKLTCENVFEQISIYAKRSVDIHIERSKHIRRSLRSNDDYDRVNSDIDEDEDDEDSFSDIENVDWPTIKNTLSSSDSWSICRLGDYFVKTGKNKRRRHNDKSSGKEKMLKNNHNDEIMISNSDNSSTEEFDMLDDIYRNQPLFRLMPQTSNNLNTNIQPIVEPGDDSDKILRHHTTFSIDWFTDNKSEAPLRVIPSKHRNGINGLIEDSSVLDSSCGDQDISLQQCLQMFIEPEVLGPDDKWYCPNCKEHMQAEKKMSVWRLPPILIIHLKRFKYYHGSSFGYLSDSRVKIDTTVKCPVHDLNMGPYCSSTTDTSQSRYDLFGIINHRGSAWFGHYTSYARLLAYNDSAKSEIGWRNFDDEHVSSLSQDKDLVRSDAYVLFYRHRHLPVNFHINEQNSSPISMDTCDDILTMDTYDDALTVDSSHMKDVNDLFK